MNRLQDELQRLYLLPDASLVGGAGEVRALVLQLAAPADWDALSAAWQAVQTGLDLPAPGIAVDGRDGLQLWFSLAQPVAFAQARAFLQALAARHLPGIRPHRLRLLPELATPPGAWPAAQQPARHPAQQSLRHAALVPAVHADTGLWSAFVSADLAPMLADAPWLDSAPGSGAQAGLLARLQCIGPTAWQRACLQLGLALEPDAAAAPSAAAARPAMPSSTPEAASAQPAATGVAPAAVAAEESTAPSAHPLGCSPADGDARARAFLAGVMNDPAAALALRIEAARALLLTRCCKAQ